MTHENSENPQRGPRHRLFIIIGAIIALVALGVWVFVISIPDDAEPSTSASMPQDVGIDPQFGETIPTDLRFLDESGHSRALSEFLTDKPVILSLVYFECPMLCNLSMDGLVRGMRVLEETAGEDFTLLTVSFDPREGPKLAAAAKHTALSRYGRESARSGWYFLTDPGDAAKQLADAVGFEYKYDQKSAQYVHAAGIFVLSPEGKITRFLNGVEYAPRDLKLALAEASEGKTNSLHDKILLLCFHYNPESGKYGLAIFRLLRIAGIATVVCLAGSILWMSRHPSASFPQEGGNDGR